MPRGTFLPVLRLGEVELEDPADATHDPAHTDVETDAARTESVAQDGARDVLGALAQALRSAGLFAPLIRYPGVRGAHSIYIDGLGHLPDSVSLFPGFLMAQYGQIDTHALTNAPISGEQTA